MMSWKRPVMLGVLLAAMMLACAQAQEAVKPLIGGSLTWEVDRDFRQGTRKVCMHKSIFGEFDCL